MIYKKLYKLNSDGKTIQEWAIHHDSNSFWTVSGQVGGQLVVSKPTAVVPKVKRTMEQQIQLEMDSKINKKRKGRYVDDINDVQHAEENLEGISPLLAKNFTDFKDKLEFPLYSDPKLNGMRCIATKNGLFTRKRDKIVAVPHIEKTLQFVFQRFPDAVLDGELYNHENRYLLNQTLAIVRKTKNITAEDLTLSEKMIQYHVYDAYNIPSESSAIFSVRKKETKDILKNTKYIHIVDSILIKNHAELDKIYKHYLQKEYEGQIVRANVGYDFKRSKNLLKRKEFQDEEFETVDILPGKGNKADLAARVECRLPNGDTFGSNIKGDFTFLADVLQNKKKYIGKMATVKFHEYNEYGVPMYAHVIAWRPD